MTTAPPPPEHLSLFVEVLGVDDTLRLIEAHGGTRLWVPKGVDNSSVAAREVLEQRFGKPMTKELIIAFGGDFIQVPLCHEWRTLLYRHQGMSMPEIARKLNCHTVTVARRLSRAAGKTNQSTFAF